MLRTTCIVATLAFASIASAQPYPMPQRTVNRVWPLGTQNHYHTQPVPAAQSLPSTSPAGNFVTRDQYEADKQRFINMVGEGGPAETETRGLLSKVSELTSKVDRLDLGKITSTVSTIRETQNEYKDKLRDDTPSYILYLLVGLSLLSNFLGGYKALGLNVIRSRIESRFAKDEIAEQVAKKS